MSGGDNLCFLFYFFGYSWFVGSCFSFFVCVAVIATAFSPEAASVCVDRD